MTESNDTPAANESTPSTRRMHPLLTGILAGLLGALLVLGLQSVLPSSDPIPENERRLLEADWGITDAKSKKEVCKTKEEGTFILLIAFRKYDWISVESIIQFWEEQCQ